MTNSIVHNSEFDALAFEIKHAKNFEQSQKEYFDPQYKIDSDRDWCGCLYRVWDRKLLIGTFYLKNKKWLANPYYKNRQYLGLGQLIERRFRSNQLAIDYIIRSYKG